MVKTQPTLPAALLPESHRRRWMVKVPPAALSEVGL